MSTTEFEQLTLLHSLTSDPLYNSNAFCGEAGEVANAVKKIEMAKMNPDWVNGKEGSLKSEHELRTNKLLELGDALFYLTKLVVDEGWTLEAIMIAHENKLKKQSHEFGHTFLK